MSFPRSRSASSAEEEKRSVEKETVSHSELPELRAVKPRLPVGWRVLILVLTCLCSCECFLLGLARVLVADVSDSRKSLE